MKNWRTNLILFFFFLLGATIIGRLIYIQIINQDFYKALALGQQHFSVQVQGRRGEVFLKEGKNLVPFAINKTWPFSYAVPKEIENKEGVAERLAEILNFDKNEILEKIQNSASSFAPIKSKLSEREVEELEKINLPGVYLENEVLRYYPQGTFGSQLIGFLGGEGKGQYGIEGFYDQILTTETDYLEGKRGLGGDLIFLDSENLLPVQKGADLILSLDYNIQFRAERLLAEAKENLDIEGGEIIVVDPNSGKILALANFPNFDPNSYASYAQGEEIEIFQNSAIQKLFEPGSIFKPVTMAAALEEEKITPYTTYIDRGFVRIGRYTIYNYDEVIWGEQTMTQVLENSINTGAVFVEEKLGHHLFLKYIEKFGIFEPTGIDLQGEVFSENKEFKKGYEINFATASFGQGIEMTPLQIVRAISVIANGGKLVKPYLVEKIITNRGIVEVQPEIENPSVISSRTASQLTAMLVNSVENGYAKRAKIPNYYIAGKTGTSQIPFSNLGINKSGYSDKTWQTFIGFAPAFDPKFLILVKLDNPKAKAAGYSTTLIARDLMKYIIDYYQIPPDYSDYGE